MKEKGVCFLCCDALIPSLNRLMLRVRGAHWGLHIHTLKGTANDTQPVKPLSLQPGVYSPCFPCPLPRPGLESITDRVTLSDYEARRLLNALVKEFIQMTAEELEQASEGNR